MFQDFQDVDISMLFKKRYSDMNGNEKVKFMYLSLFKQVEEMDKFIGNCTANIEKDYLSAYRGQMTHIIEELKKFKKKVNDQKHALKSDLKVQNLQAEVDYF